MHRHNNLGEPVQVLRDAITCIERDAADKLPACPFTAHDNGVYDMLKRSGIRAAEFACKSPDHVPAHAIAESAATRISAALASLTKCSKDTVSRQAEKNGFSDLECAIQSQPIAEMASALGQVRDLNRFSDPMPGVRSACCRSIISTRVHGAHMMACLLTTCLVKRRNEVQQHRCYPCPWHCKQVQACQIRGPSSTHV